MATAQNGTRTSGRPSWLARAIITVVSLGIFAIAALLSVRMFGCVQGIEFSPDTFESRTFVYYEIPLIRARVTGVHREDISGTLQGTVAGMNLVRAAAADPPHWHLVAMTRGSAYYQDDALIIYQYFQNYNQLTGGTATSMFGESPAAEFWRNWTTRHDELAEILWPAVAEVCRRDLYIFAPELFTAAEQLTVAEAEPDPQQFEQALDEVLAEQYTQLGDIRRARGQHKEALEMYTAALDHVQDYAPALSGSEKLPQNDE